MTIPMGRGSGSSSSGETTSECSADHAGIVAGGAFATATGARGGVDAICTDRQHPMQTNPTIVESDKVVDERAIRAADISRFYGEAPPHPNRSNIVYDHRAD